MLKDVILDDILDSLKNESKDFSKTYDIVEFTINKVIEKLYKRTCDNCKFIFVKKYIRAGDVAFCTNTNCIEMYDCEVGDDFCCNKWEFKNDKN
jgi:hypothetical protein